MTTPRRPAVFLDRDGTLIEDPGYLADPVHVRLLPMVPIALRRLADAGYLRVVVTNQSGIGRKLYSTADFLAVEAAMEHQLALGGGAVDAVYHCPHLPTDGCACRKPGTLLHATAATEHHLDLATSWCIGDRLGDVLAAKAIGARAILVRTGEGRHHEEQAEALGFPVVADLMAAVTHILDQQPD